MTRNRSRALTMARTKPDGATVGEVIAMALGDQVRSARIRALHGLGLDEVQALMRRELRPGSDVALRKRVRQFTDRRETYK